MTVIGTEKKRTVNMMRNVVPIVRMKENLVKQKFPKTLPSAFFRTNAVVKSRGKMRMVVVDLKIVVTAMGMHQKVIPVSLVRTDPPKESQALTMGVILVKLMKLNITVGMVQAGVELGSVKMSKKRLMMEM